MDGVFERFLFPTLRAIEAGAARACGIDDACRQGVWLIFALLALLALLLAVGLRKAFAGSGNPDEEARAQALQEYEQGNFALAANLLLPLAEHGDAYGQATLGRMNLNGDGVNQDYIQAHKWLTLAMSRFPESDEAARSKALRDIAFLESRMNPLQIEQARRLAAAWGPAP